MARGHCSQGVPGLHQTELALKWISAQSRVFSICDEKTKAGGARQELTAPQVKKKKKKTFKKGDSLKYLITLQNQTSSGKANCALVKVSCSSKIRVITTDYLFSSEFLSICAYIS